MNELRRFLQFRKRRVLLATSSLLVGLFILHFTVYGHDKSGFPDGFDAVQAAPKSHRVVFENAFVRVLEVSVSTGITVPMHDHHCPVSSSLGILAARRHIFTIGARTVVFETFRA